MMWSYLYGLWRSVLKAPDVQTPAGPPAPPSSRTNLQEELRGLMEERTTLQRTAASYEDFGYDDMAAAVRDQLRLLQRRIRSARRALHGPDLIWKEGLEGPESR